MQPGGDRRVSSLKEIRKGFNGVSVKTLTGTGRVLDELVVGGANESRGKSEGSLSSHGKVIQAQRTRVTIRSVQPDRWAIVR